MRGLYAILDLTTVERACLDPIAVLSALLEARPACVQLRAKDASPKRTLELLRSMSSLAKSAGVPFFANDRPDLALLADCDGVHVGQDDLAPEDVREIVEAYTASQRARGSSGGSAISRPPFIVGLSTHNAEQAIGAVDAPIDYLAIGPVLATTSKANPDPVLGLDGARSIASAVKAKRSSLPIVAIGGLSYARAKDLVGIVDMVAVIGALYPNESMPTSLALDYIRNRALEIASMFDASAR